MVLRNFEGVITTYPEPENYEPGKADDFFGQVYPDYMKKDSKIGISGLMNDHLYNLVPQGLNRLERRHTYMDNPKHSSLKDKREKRDQLKEKKYMAEQQKSQQGIG